MKHSKSKKVVLHLLLLIFTYDFWIYTKRTY
ncbi:MAG: hypothetical protein JWM28_2798 [Chitinophagaceae bacterium]|nr:hypothetical protein [Chitinophagaceae bacterium]